MVPIMKVEPIMKSVDDLAMLRRPLLSAAVLMASLATAFGLGCADNGPSYQGISDDEILFGQSAVISGPSQELGKGMRLGIEAAFHEVNRVGGVHGRALKLRTVDDGYEPDYAVDATEWLIERDRVFALIGAVGTPTSRAAYPLADDAGVPFIAPFTGAEFLRDPGLRNVINVRASYHQETEALVKRLVEHLWASRIAVLYQDDTYGRNGLDGVRAALELRDLEPVGSWSYQRNFGVGSEKIAGIVAADPDAVIVIGTHSPVATTVASVRKHIDPIFMTVSFGGGTALAGSLGRSGEGVYVSQVVPFPTDTDNPLVAHYHSALAEYSPQALPGFVSLEGYLAGRLAIFGLETCGREVDRRCFMDALRSSGVIDIEGFPLEYGPGDHQGSDAVFLTVMRSDGKLHRADKLETLY